MSKKQFKVGDRVRLSASSKWVDSDSKDPKSSNPLGIEGTIDSYSDNDCFRIEVMWDNGRHNSYDDNDLVLVKKSKEETFEVDEEFIKEAHASACLKWKKKIEAKFPEAFKSKYYEFPRQVTIGVTNSDAEPIRFIANAHKHDDIPPMQSLFVKPEWKVVVKENEFGTFIAFEKKS